MKKWFQAGFFLAALLGLSTAFASRLVTKPSSHNVQETMDRLEKIVQQKGMTVFARIDHRANAEKVGEKMPAAQVLIFGNPKAGTRIMLRDTRAGLDLPIRVLVYQDYDGKTWIVYHDPMELKETYNEEGCVVLDKMQQALKKITDAAAN